MQVMDTTYNMQSKLVIGHSQAMDATQIIEGTQVIESVHVNKANVCVVHGTLSCYACYPDCWSYSCHTGY